MLAAERTDAKTNDVMHNAPTERLHNATEAANQAVANPKKHLQDHVRYPFVPHGESRVNT